MTQATKRPWEVLKMDNGDISVCTMACDGVSDICYMNSGLDHEANAKLIVKAVNRYDNNQETIKSQDAQLLAMDALLQKEKLKVDELIEALKECQRFIPYEYPKLRGKVEQTLSKAQEAI